MIWALLNSWAEICQNFRWFFGKFKKSKRHSEIIWPLVVRENGECAGWQGANFTNGYRPKAFTAPPSSCNNNARLNVTRLSAGGGPKNWEFYRFFFAIIRSTSYLGGILGHWDILIWHPLVSRIFLDVSSLTFPFLQMLKLEHSDKIRETDACPIDFHWFHEFSTFLSY